MKFSSMCCSVAALMERERESSQCEIIWSTRTPTVPPGLTVDSFDSARTRYTNDRTRSRCAPVRADCLSFHGVASSWAIANGRRHISLYRREKATLVQSATDETWGQRNPELRYVHGRSSHHSPRREVRRAETKGEGRGRDGREDEAVCTSGGLAGWVAGCPVG